MSSHLLIEHTEDVEALARDLAGAPRIAVDTEFHAERRYRPRLLLLQLAVEGGPVHLVDPLRCELQALGPPLEQAELLVHGGLHDIQLVSAATGAAPQRIFDTQRAAGMVGLPFPMRLDDLIAQVLGVQLPHGLALSNWGQRPLREDQLAYAAADVALLFRLQDDLSERLQARDRLAWARAAGAELVEEAAAPPRPVDDWRRWDIAPGLDEAERRVVQALMHWRQAEAERRDQPPHYLLGDALALALARTRPTQVEDMAGDRRFNSGLRKRFGAELVEVIRAALDPASPAPPPVHPLAGARRAMLSAWSSALETQTGLAALLALPATLRRQIAEAGPSALTGWRAEALGQRLDDFWSGRRALRFDPAATALRVVDDMPWVDAPAPRS